MDFPLDQVTNVYSTLIPAFRWTLFQLTQSASPIIGNQTDSPAKSLSPGESAFETQVAFFQAVQHIRASGGHAIHHAASSALWLFETAESGDDLLSVHSVDHSSLVDVGRFKVTQAGTFASHQLEYWPKTSFEREQTTKDVNSDEKLSEHPLLFPALDEKSKAIAVYQAFASAVLSSFINSLTAGGQWTPFGADSCVRVLDDPIFSAKSSDTAHRPYGNPVQQLCLDAQWSSSGILTVRARATQHPQLHRLPEVIKIRDTSGKSILDGSAPIFISPYGSCCTLVDSNLSLVDSRTASRHAKELTRNLLKSAGIAFPEDTSWVCLQPAHGRLQMANQRGERVWWPAHLCFILLTLYRTPSNSTLQRIADDTFVDPLVEAEQWFLGREARNAAIAAKEKDDKEAQRQATLVPDTEEPQEDTRAAAVRAARTEQYLSAQEASGIYPTPPDGLTFHSHDSTVNQDSLEGPASEARPPSVIDQEHRAGSLITSPVTNIAERSFEDGVDQALFGDMDTDMFDANGLTEDDFNFFDKPDIKEDVQFEIESPALLRPEASPTKNLKNLISLGSPDHGDPRDVAAGAADDTNDSADGDSGRANQSRQSSPGQTHDISGRTSQTSKSSSVSGNLDDDTGFSPSITLGQTTEDAEMTHTLAAFGMQSHTTSQYRISEKYLSNGRYATSLPDHMDGSRPSLNHRSIDHGLPHVGVPAAGNDDTPEDTEDTVSDNQSVEPWNSDNCSISSGDPTVSYDDRREKTSSSRKRKRVASDRSINLVTPAESMDSAGSPVDSVNNISIHIERTLFGYRNTKDLVTSYEATKGKVAFAFIGDNQEFIQIAQLVADQEVLKHGIMNAFQAFDDKGSASSLLPADCGNHLLALDQVLLESFSSLQQHDLRSFSGLDLNSSTSMPSKGSVAQEIGGRKEPTAHSVGLTSREGMVAKAQPPYMSARRGDDAIDLTPPAISFWEELGLGPTQKKKNVITFCIYPENVTVRDAAETLLATMENSYQSCRFGHHQRGSGVQKYTGGLVPVPIFSADPNVVLERLGQVCEDLGAEIPTHGPDGAHYVIYMVNPFNDNDMHSHLCAAFLKLFSVYAARLKKGESDDARDLVLQIIPFNFLVECDCLVIPPPKAYAQLAFEIYSRCSPRDANDEAMLSPFTSGSAIRLARSIPKTINFRLSSQPFDGLLSYDPCMHLAYSWDPGQQWLSCAWSDNLGTKQWCVSYCLQDSPDNFWQIFSATVQEILDTTKDMLVPADRPWKLHVVKDRDIQQQELDIWRFHSTSLSQQSTKVTILSIDANPPLSFPVNKTPITLPDPSTDNTSPQASTPHEQILTPDHSSPTTIQTPNRQTHNSPAANLSSGFTESNPAARLIDVVSETWYMISPMPIPDPYLPNPHLASVSMSGYIIKRAGPDDEDGLITLGVNLVRTNLAKDEKGTTQEQEEVLREVLAMYADLACLARMRGTEEWRTGVLPWHVAAATKARKAVSRCMRWGKKREAE